MGESIVIPADRAVWIRVAVLVGGEFRIRLSAGEYEETWTNGGIGDFRGRILRHGIDFVSPLTITVDRRGDQEWEVCRTVQSLEDHSTVTVIWIGAEVDKEDTVELAHYSDVIISLIWTDTDAATNLLTR